MNREIKFKAYVNRLKQIREVTKIDFLTGKIFVKTNYEGFEGYTETSKCVLLQYTGLKDINKKEIYEGDILLYNNKSKLVVSYKNGAFTRSYQNSNIHLMYDSFMDDGILCDYKIIGNIYENKDLLEKINE